MATPPCPRTYQTQNCSDDQTRQDSLYQADLIPCLKKLFHRFFFFLCRFLHALVFLAVRECLYYTQFASEIQMFLHGGHFRVIVFLSLSDSP